MTFNVVALVVVFGLLTCGTSTVTRRKLRIAAVQGKTENSTEVEDHPSKETLEEFKQRTGDHNSGEWSYKATRKWANFDSPFCDGPSQSPIDIVTSKVTILPDMGPSTLVHDIMTPRLQYKGLGGRTIENHGHNVQVNGNFGTLELPNGLYDVVQFNFHFPSEHSINGDLKTGEMHIVHRQQGTQGTQSLAVIAILLQEELITEYRETLELDFLTNLGFGDVLPNVGSELPVMKTVDILAAFPRVLEGGFYHYYGSLTAPPCTETVHWYVMQTPAVVTHDMIESFKKIFHDPANNRPVMPLNGREIGFNVFEVPGEFEHEHDDYERHSEAHGISLEDSEYHVAQGHVGPELQLHHGEKGAAQGRDEYGPSYAFLKFISLLFLVMMLVLCCVVCCFMNASK